MNGLRLNTTLTAFAVVLLGVLSFLGAHVWNETATTHDAVLIIKSTMVNQAEFLTLKAQVIHLEQKQVELAQKQIEQQHAQDQLSLEIRRIKQSTINVKP